MKVLVVCPTYGRLPFLNRMLASFLSQTYIDKHLVIVNDDVNVRIVCNEDNVTCINMDTKMLIPQKHNIGNALNYSDLIMPFDDDDIFMPNRIANSVKAHKENPNVGMFVKLIQYTLYGDIFSHGGCSPTVCSYTRKTWNEVGGYKYYSNHGEDIDFFNSIKNKVVTRDDKELDFVYNYGNINYHASSVFKEGEVERIAKRQLEQMNMVGKEYILVPDYEEYNKFVELGRRYDADRIPIKVNHVGYGKIDIS